MAFRSSETLVPRIWAERYIFPYEPGRVKHCSYEMAVGGEAFVTSKSADGPRLPAGVQVEIPPGHFGRLITAEDVTVPPGRYRLHIDPGRHQVPRPGESQTIRID